jgi:hypothetical protein
MVKETLLDLQIEAGKKLLQALDERGFDITTAMWFYDPDLGTWKLFLHSSQFDKKDQIASYIKISEVIKELGDKLNMLSLDSIKLVFENDHYLIKMFKKIVHVKKGSLVRMTANYIDGIYIDDALIYRN